MPDSQVQPCRKLLLKQKARKSSFSFFFNKQKVMTLSLLLQDFKSFISIFLHKEELYFF